MIIAILVTLALIVLGVSVAFSFGIGAIIAFLQLDIPLTEVPSLAYHSIDSYPLLAIPFFLLAGVVMQVGGVSQRLVDFIALLTGRIKGSLGATLIGSSALFGAISGSSVATVSAIGSVMTPEMVKRGYPKNYIGGLLSVAGVLGILIPPSIPMVVYAIIAQVSIGKMFLAGVLPGIMLMALMLVINAFWAKRLPNLSERVELAGSSGGRLGTKILAGTKLTTSATPALVMPVIILGGIYAGIFTPTEAGAVAVAYGIIVGVLVYRGLSARRIPKVLLDGLLATAPLLIIMAMGSVFSRALIYSGATRELAAYVAALDVHPSFILLVLNLIMLGTGLLVEENTAIIILAPVLLPIALTMGVDPIHFGIIMILNFGLGLATPPMAPNLFVASRVVGIPFHKILKVSLSFLTLAGLPVLVLVNVFPWISTWML